MTPMLVLQVCGAAIVIALGLMLIAVSSVAVGAVLGLLGGAWFVWCLRRA